ncbi:MAG: ABC transporter substrate-binding protein [Dehalococcoidales bacterium]|nr:ABC transporter substrate-binding protein [Dehalococcoidales bacterium]
MKTKILMLPLAILLSVILIMTPFVAGCSQEEDGGTLKIGSMTPATGPVADKGLAGRHGLEDAIKYINTELGGVRGHPIELVYRDSGYDASKVVTIVKEFMDEGCLMFTTHSSTEMSYAMGIANDAGFPGMATYASPIIYRPPRHIYGQAPDYGDDWTAFATYYMKNIWKGYGKPKMALLLLNNPTGKGAKDGATAMADKLGIELLTPEEHASTTISEMEALTRVKAKNPDVIFISSTPAPTAVILRNIRDLQMSNITIGLGHASLTKALVDLAGADVAEGTYGVVSTAAWTDNVPGLAKAKDYCQQYNPQDSGNTDYLSTWTTALIAAQILQHAVDNVGYDKLAKGDAEAWSAIEQNGIQKLSGYDVQGLQGPVRYTVGDNRLDKLLRVCKVTNGQIMPITDWTEAPLIKYEEFSWFGAK